jgi:undecaprenyl-diphosphatase
VPGLCGVSRIPYRKFLFWNALGGIVWATGFTLLGYAAGNAWHKVEHYASLVSWVLLGLVVVGAVVLFVLKKRKGGTAVAEHADHDVDRVSLQLVDDESADVASTS